MKHLTILVLLFPILAAFGCRDDGPGPSTEATPTSTSVSNSSTGSPDAGASSEPPAATPGVTHGTLRHDGNERTYRLFVPSGLAAGERVPLVVGLHGGLGWGDQFAANSRFEATAQEHGFIAAFPDGLNRTWNGGNCCGAAARNRVDDVGFLASLIGQLQQTLPIDPERVFMTGHSNGGIMAFRFACERPEVVRAIAPVAGSLETEACPAPSGTSLFAIHGDSDKSHPLEGGQGPRSIAGVDFVSMKDSLATWTRSMGCEATPVRTTSGAVTSTVWSSCKGGAQAALSVIAGADHPWPGGTGGALGGAEVSDALDATTAIWAFFDSLD